MDWFVILTPILLIPIALLLFFVGCSLLFSAADPTEADVTIVVSFFPGTIDSSCSTYRVVVGGLATDDIEDIVPAELGMTSDQVLLNAGPFSTTAGEKAAITCTVFEPCANNPNAILLRMGNTAMCTATLEAGHDYTIGFSAIRNRRRFPDCQVIDTT